MGTTILGRVRARPLTHAAVVSALVVVSCGEPASDSSTAHTSAPLVLDGAWRDMIAAEELLQTLQAPLATVARSVENLRLPDASARRLFADAVDVTDVAAPAAETDLATWPQVRTVVWPAKTRTAAADPGDHDLWSAWLAPCRIVRGAKFGQVSGQFEDDAHERFQTRLSFHANCVSADGQIAEFSIPVRVVWARKADAPVERADSWKIVEWASGDAVELRAARPLFREALADFVVDPSALAAARISVHERLITEYLADPTQFAKPHDDFWFAAHDRHPAVAVADVDGDGLDDVYLMTRWGRNRLYFADVNGRFEERAAAVGLDIKDHCSAALFADFDNDGDADVVIGRTLLPSRYFRNDGGRFIDRSEEFWDGPAPALVASLSAADFDNDGLLDLHVATYAARMIVKQREAGISPVLEKYLTATESSRLTELLDDESAHEYLALPGPANRLYKNAGDGRMQAVDSATVGIYRNTYQATWGDYDADGDQDLYAANDFSLNNLFRNDGNGVFTDATAETGTADIGFGMGAAWGDYDGDGRDDLYVSNMFSKAGSRIMNALEPAGVDPRFRKMARGNTLFRNTDHGFEVVSRPGQDAAAVEVAGWSWGGQFADFNNDGLLDLYVPNGYYSAPPAYATPVDV